MTATVAEKLIDFIDHSPSAFHAIDNLSNRLKEAGYTELFEGEEWQLTKGGKYFVTRNSSSIAAFRVGNQISDYNFQIVSSHSDSPTFRLKEKAEMVMDHHYLKLNTEGYGGMILTSWFDRPLSLAGRVLVKDGNKLKTRLLNIDRDLIQIPNVAIHLVRDINEGKALNKQIDLLPLLGGEGAESGQLYQLIADELGVQPDTIYGMDVQLYNRTKPGVWGLNNEFFSSRQLDNLMSAYTTFEGFLAGNNDENIELYFCFDNEEVGSGTKQGALSTFSADVMHRIVYALGGNESQYYQALAKGFMVSADNAHAVHPNHPELMDDTNHTYMNQGVVIKAHAEQRYTSDAQSVAVFKALAEEANVPLQFFSNRSDKRGGSTLGNLMMVQASMNTVDVGCPQLAMHSAYETAGVKDPGYMVDVIKTFFDHHLTKEGNGTYIIQ
ncbi:MAG: M18 family aminopeptidase [Aerococcus sp.]|nr:M18 family aminopeptidase [Aerococcus sp.]